MIARAKNENGPLERAGFSSATTTKHTANVNANRDADKALSTIRAKLAIAGGHVLHRAAADDGSLTYFVVSPWGHIQKFSDVDALRAFAEKGARA